MMTGRSVNNMFFFGHSIIGLVLCVLVFVAHLTGHITIPKETFQRKHSNESLPTTFMINEEQSFCYRNEELMNGTWIELDVPLNGMNSTWSPNGCILHYFSRDEISQCFSDQKVAFFGDSLLLNVFGQLGELRDTSRWQYGSGGHQSVLIDDNSSIVFWWAPSAYYQQPHTLSQSRLSELDTVIVGIGVWDMGTYYQGIDNWYNTMTNNLKRTRGAMKLGARLLLFNLHKLFPERCDDKDGPCFKCNQKTKESLFRSAIYKMAACIEGVELYDTLGMTDNEFTKNEKKNSSDAVHHGPMATHGEMRVLLSLLCEHPDGSMVQPAVPNGTCDEMQGEFDEYLKGYEREKCIGDDWKPAHN